MIMRRPRLADSTMKRKHKKTGCDYKQQIRTNWEENVSLETLAKVLIQLCIAKNLGNFAGSSGRMFVKQLFCGHTEHPSW